jgi:uncharacterized protein Veg
MTHIFVKTEGGKKKEKKRGPKILETLTCSIVGQNLQNHIGQIFSFFLSDNPKQKAQHM